jgi:eukaryotic-like serine/threonine-protein kinase
MVPFEPMVLHELGYRPPQVRLGAGGMGEVFLAQHRHMERRAAIKFLLPDLSTREDVVERFFTEGRATSRISHPGILEILDCDRNAAGIAYIVMEFLEGEGLGTSLDRVPAFGSRSTFGIVGQIASALGAAHANPRPT